jgi:pimeloyl-ACP methyl ester carboxylesterase
VRFGNFWSEDGQAAALTQGDVSRFALPVDWNALAARRATGEPRPTGWSNRWYVSSLNLGQGVVPNTGSSPGGDLRPNFLGRIQPYGVYVPTSYDPARPTPLTWVLHSLGVNHNQYSSLGPKFLQGLCEQRRSICATTLGYGPDGWYFDEAENDFWSVWRSLASAYRLDPERTVISGYSMGGFASYKLGLSYPDLFAKAMPLAGPPRCGLRVIGGVEGPAGPGRCTTDGSTTALVPNAREVPYVLADGVLDELVPFTSVLQQVAAFDRAKLRYHFEAYPAEDHLVYATQDGFSSVVSQIGNARRTRNPGTVDYRWYPHLNRADLGTGPTGDYWVRELSARSSTAGSTASVLATSGMRPEPRHTVVKHVSTDVPGDPSPDVVVDNTWKLGATPAARAVLTLTTANVAHLAIDMVRAGFRPGQASRISARSDAPTTLVLHRLAPGSRVRVGPRTVVAHGSGTAVVPLPAGASTVSVG